MKEIKQDEEGDMEIEINKWCFDDKI